MSKKGVDKSEELNNFSPIVVTVAPRNAKVEPLLEFCFTCYDSYKKLTGL